MRTTTLIPARFTAAPSRAPETRVELVVWNQGETDGALSVSKEDYKQDMQVLLSRLREDLGVSDLPLFLCQIGTHAENISNNEAYTGIRSAQLELDDGKNFFLAATEMEFERKDTAHYKTPGLNEIGRRVTTPHAGYDRAVGHHVTLEFLALVDQQGIVDDSIVHGDI